jgi:dihydropteroate synthase
MTLLRKGASLIRAHDVRETVDTVRVFERLAECR